MLSFPEALSKILDEVKPLGRQTLLLSQLSGHFLAEPVVTPMDLPMFDNSAVDGYGVLLQDVSNACQADPAELELLGTIQAGESGEIAIGPGQTVKILTGAPVPQSVQAVVMREYCRESGTKVAITCRATQGENIRRRGDEFHQGQQILAAGIRVSPPVIGLLATLGYAEFPVCKKPCVAVLVTGNELVEPGKSLAPGQIFDSNSFAMLSALYELGLGECKSFHARDDKEATHNVLREALASADVVISTGGVSVGDYDYVKEIAEGLGVTTVFWRIALKPGKPVYFGVRGSQLVFGLPGNPVSSLVTFHQLVKPALIKMMGGTPRAVLAPATLASPLKKRAGRLEFVRGRLNLQDKVLSVSPVSGQESHMLGGLAQADCLICFATEAESLPAGSPVTVELLNWQD